MPRNITLFMTLLFATVALMLVGARPRGSVAGTGIPDVAGTWQGTWSHRHGSGRIRPPRSKEEFFYGKKNGHATTGKGQDILSSVKTRRFAGREAFTST
jgi:hypothetical protein